MTNPSHNGKPDPSNLVFRMGELFCGPGGLALGASLASHQYQGIEYKIEHVWANDFDSDTCKTFKHNIAKENKCKVICGDVRELDFEKLFPIEALAFGFPCNDFSMVGEQKGMNGVYGPLYSYGVKALQHFQPLWFMAENVSGLRNSNDGKAFEIIKAEMRNAGYKIYPHLYKFENYGVPQARHRLIIVGIRSDIQIGFTPPLPNGRVVSSREAIENPPIPKYSANNELTTQSETVIKRLSHILPGENAFTADLPEALKLNVKGMMISQIYRRLDPDKPAYTITGSGGGGTHVYHWQENRALTNRERARLQTFPDDFIFLGSKECVRKQIGMAVPPLGVKVIFDAVLKLFANSQDKWYAQYLGLPQSWYNSAVK